MNRAAAAVPEPPRLPAPTPIFTEFYQRHREEIRRFAWHYGAAHLDPDAIAAEAWARACANWSAISNPRPWLYQVVINLTCDAGKAAQQTIPAVDPHATLALGRSPVWTSVVTVPDVEYAVRITDVGQALQRLPRQQRAAVLLDYQGMTRPEIAAALGCTTITVRGHLHRGRASLRRMLAEHATAARPAHSTGLEGSPA